jgi:transposase InsO family protein
VLLQREGWLLNWKQTYRVYREEGLVVRRGKRKRIAAKGGVSVLERLAEFRGLPQSMTVDNGPEFVSKAMDDWAYRQQLQIRFIEPGKPQQNCYIGSFNGKFRDECLNEHLCLSMRHA